MFILPVCLDFDDDDSLSDESLATQIATVSFGPNPTHGGLGVSIKKLSTQKTFIHSFVNFRL